MSEIFGKIFGKDKHGGHKEKGGDKSGGVAGNTKWQEFCKYNVYYSYTTVGILLLYYCMYITLILL